MLLIRKIMVCTGVTKVKACSLHFGQRTSLLLFFFFFTGLCLDFRERKSKANTSNQQKKCKERGERTDALEQN